LAQTVRALEQKIARPDAATFSGTKRSPRADFHLPCPARFPTARTGTLRFQTLGT
jgi:hypothetical protein